jgi:hypothetical protein
LNFFFEDGLDGVTGSAGNSFPEIVCFYTRGTLSLQGPVPGCSVLVWRRKYFLIGGKTVKKSADFRNWL